jgi:thiol-disulfide isomerase/thioredoxin
VIALLFLAFHSLTFHGKAFATPETPEVQPVGTDELAHLIRSSKAKVTFLNLWAAYCGPCLSELTAILNMQRSYGPADVNVILLSVDPRFSQRKVQAVLDRYHVDFQTYLLAGRLPFKWSGVLPTAALYAPGGKLLEFWRGGRSEERLLKVLSSHLGRTVADSTLPGTLTDCVTKNQQINSSTITTCESYCAAIGKVCVSSCTTPGGASKKATISWPSGQNCSGPEGGVGPSCTFLFTDGNGEPPYTPRWKCCCH